MTTEREQLPFDPMQPIELDDGTPCRISLRENDGTSMNWRVTLQDYTSCGDGCAAGSYWFHRDDHVLVGCPNRHIQNVDPTIPEHLRKARRDYARLPDDLKPDFLDADWFAPHADVHFPQLVERDEVAMVSFFENERKLEVERRTEMRVGRYVRRFNGGKLKDEDVERIAASSDVKLRGNRVKITQDADDIETVYVNGPNSCMSDCASQYDTDGIHPARVYAGPDLGIAYIGDLDDPSSRCVVWPEKKVYGRIYGDETRMEQMLRQLGFQSGSMCGARVRLIECDCGTVMPYVDGVSRASIRGEYVVLGHGHDLDCTNTNGLGSDETRVSCEHCDDFVSEDDAYIVYTSRHGSETWCSDCRSSDATYCNYAEEYVRDDSMVTVYTSTGREESCADWELDRHDFVNVTAGDHEGELWHVDATGTHDGDTYHVDDLPEDADDDAESRSTLALPTVEEAEAAGQLALPLDTPGEFKLLVSGPYWAEPTECEFSGALGGEPRKAGTYAEAVRVRDFLAPNSDCTYRIEPVNAATEFRLMNLAKDGSREPFQCSLSGLDGAETGSFDDCASQMEDLTRLHGARFHYWIEAVDNGAPGYAAPFTAALAIAA